MNKAFRSILFILISLSFNSIYSSGNVYADNVPSSVTVEKGEVKGAEVEATDVVVLFVSPDCEECDEVSTYFQKTLGTGSYNLQTEDISSTSGGVLYDKIKNLCEDGTDLPVLSYGENCINGTDSVRAKIGALAVKSSDGSNTSENPQGNEQTQQESPVAESQKESAHNTGNLSLPNLFL
ncbi:hypothetical protein KC622_00525, partial [Candidatus Dojkabacteria bacterium]|nr:hypothetical protein [Candidatus Dojkabacteria bacterium]